MAISRTNGPTVMMAMVLLAVQIFAMLTKAEAEIVQEKKKAINETKDEISGMAVDIASKVVEREISAKDHEKLIEDFIKNVGEAS